jgi:hypothetical protein
MDMIARVCALPVEYEAREDVSIFRLVEESGYVSARATLTVDVVSEYLREHPDLIEAWLGYSEDKRTSSGWYITRRSGAAFEIGYFPQGERISVADPARACAEFVVREIRAIAG